MVDKARKKPAEVAPADGQLARAHRTKLAAAMVAAAGHGRRPEAPPPVREADGKHAMHPLDATLVDVYSNAHAAVFCVDPSKPWTYEYVKRELARVPLHIPACVLVGFRDYGASRRSVLLAQV